MLQKYMSIWCKWEYYYLLIVMLGITVFSSCQDDLWSEHYNTDTQVSSRVNLWETIKANPQLKKFAWALRETGYDKELSSPVMLTVWAPVDSLENIDTTNVAIDAKQLLKEYVKNHISKYSYTASGDSTQRILLKNNKVQAFSKQSDGFYMGKSKLLTGNYNIGASNGVLHLVKNKINFFYNIWELLDSDQKFDSISSYLHSFDQIYFDEKNSTPGGVVDGKQVYLDSVIYNYNSRFLKMGSLANEDSTYHTLFFTNIGWDTAYSKVKDFYRYYAGTTASSKITADTLQQKYTKNAMTQDLVFRNNTGADTLISTIGNKFFRPFDGTQEVLASNGTVYVTDELKYKSWESWNKEIRVEAERTTGRTIEGFNNLYDRSYTGDDSLTISKRKYILVTPQYPGIKSAVTFEIPNTLSGKLNRDSTINYGAAYNIYCVFAPNVLISNTPKLNKVNFMLYFQNELGASAFKSYPAKSTSYFTTSPYYMTKVLVASKVVFPCSEYGLPTTSVKLKVSSYTSKETTTDTRDLLIDCVILEPVH